MVNIEWEELHKNFMESKITDATEFVESLNLELSYNECWLIKQWEIEKSKNKSELKAHNSIGILDSLLNKLSEFSKVKDLQSIKEYADVLCKVMNVKQKIDESKANKNVVETSIFLINKLSGKGL